MQLLLVVVTYKRSSSIKRGRQLETRTIRMSLPVSPVKSPFPLPWSPPPQDLLSKVRIALLLLQLVPDPSQVRSICAQSELRGWLWQFCPWKLLHNWCLTFTTWCRDCRIRLLMSRESFSFLGEWIYARYAASLALLLTLGEANTCANLFWSHLPTST